MLTSNPPTSLRPTLEDGRVYRLAELAKVFAVSERTLRRACEAQLFPEGRRIGRYRFWSGRVVLAWLSEALDGEGDQRGEAGI